MDSRLGRSTNYYAIATALSRDPARVEDAAGFYRRALEVASHFPGAEFGLATVRRGAESFRRTLPEKPGSRAATSLTLPRQTAPNLAVNVAFDA